VTRTRLDPPITADEVREWLKGYGNPRPSEAVCAKVADVLTKMRWASDPNPPPIPEPSPDADPWWEFKSVAAAAKILHAAVPRMLRHWDGLRWAPETAAGHSAVKALGDALEVALPYIEFPFGPGEPQSPQQRPRPKKWHTPAIVIANIFVAALQGSGHQSPALSHNSTVVGAVSKVLVRIEICHG
jgi:hypothetical protein